MKPGKAITAPLTKRSLINKANTTTLIAAGVAAFIVVFSLVACRTLFGQATYQNRVIGEKKKTLAQINANLDARDDLVKSYNAFISTSQNIIGGNPAGTGDRDGDNAKIILDALPSKYDFPALTASLEKLSLAQGLTIENITGTDDEVAQKAQQSSTQPVQVPIAFQLVVKGGYPQVQGLIDSFDRSIRPVQVQKISITGSNGGVTANIDGQTFYQPEKKLELTKKVVQ
jgi:hypothetical protein